MLPPADLLLNITVQGKDGRLSCCLKLLKGAVAGEFAGRCRVRMKLNMLRVARLSLMFVCALMSAVVGAADVKNVRLWIAPDHARLVFDLSASASHKLFTLKNPDRIVLDVDNAKFKADLNQLNLTKSPVERIRSGAKDKNDLRIVLDLKSDVRAKSFALSPNDKYGHRLVVDLYQPEKVAETVKRATPTANNPDKLRNVVIAIDAGHGETIPAL
ncbi:AMIN domain-containing protein [Aliamphritea spongicola]